jgi:RNA polymerase sigma-70 factor, ECF subfamily
MQLSSARSDPPAEAHESEETTARDLAWVSRIAQGDIGAFEAMFNAYAAPLAAFASSLSHSQEIAEEAVHDVFFAIWNSRTRLEVRHSFRAYAFQAVRNRVTSHLRHSRAERRLRLVGACADAVLLKRRAPGATDDRIEEHELRALLARVVSDLPARNREVFLLVRQQHLCYAEAAQTLGITVKAVEAHMCRAFAALRAAVSEWRG